MRVKILLPYKSLLETECEKISAPGQGGAFQILPKHVDITWTLEPGIIEIFYKNHSDYFAIDTGVLVKRGPDVFISVIRGIKGDSLEELDKSVSEVFTKLSTKEKEARLVLTKLETDTLRKFIELEK